LAGLLTGAVPLRGDAPVAVVLSGGNVDLGLLAGLLGDDRRPEGSTAPTAAGTER